MIDLKKALNNIGITDSETIIKTNYGIEVLLNEGLKFFIMAIIFLYTNLFLQYLFCLLILIPVRIFSGGFHMTSKISCAIFSITIVYLSIYLLPSLNLIANVLIILQVSSFTITILLGPVKNLSRTIYTIKRYLNLKRKLIISNIAINCVLYAFCINNIKEYYSIGVWILVLNAVQVLCAWVYRIVKGEGYDFKENIDNDIVGR